MKYKVCVVTVTYGDRFHLLKQVIDASFNEGVHKIIVVDNASSENSRNQLKEYEKSLKDKLKVIYLDENTGSAGGYKRGLEEAYKCEDCEFIWLLDDDNKPLENSLKVLLDFWDSLDVENKEENAALFAFRPRKSAFIQIKKLITIENKTNLTHIRNSFLGFHIKELHKKVYRYLTRKIFKLEKPTPYNAYNQKRSQFGTICDATYGGLLFHKSILKKIGYPNERFYVYVDDSEWSYRITKTGGKIYIVLDSEIEDLHLSSYENWDSKEPGSFLAKGDPFVVYYSVRNDVVYKLDNFVDNKIIYFINLFLYLTIITLINLPDMKNAKIILKAIRDGYKRRLGKVDFLNNRLDKSKRVEVLDGKIK
ncbi:glycosyltransferase [Desulfurella sp.]|uniref:glycosyltransferase n=1 Tax=Desulfurella sp. TaxID=1962857 RepID=UPI0025C4F8CC|nr:glycosyltransferase [Desulfurella sp.]